MKTYSYINVLMFPTLDCNLRCKYCFHAQGEYKKEEMSLSFVEKVIEKFFSEYEYVQLIWHGGEPLCVGVDFYKQIVKIEEKYSKKYNTHFDNGIMTNGTLVTEEVARFLGENNFDIGVSFDGVHNEELRGKTKEVEKGLRVLKKYNCDVDIVTVITNKNLYNQIENYKYIKRFGFEIKFNPVAKIGGGNVIDDSNIDENDYIEQCIKLFDFWLCDQDNPVILNPYYIYLRDIVEMTSSGCQRTSCLGRWIALHPNGDIYPCVRENRVDYKYGNIFNVDKIEDVWDSEPFRLLLNSSIERRSNCLKCKLYNYCHGGCPVNAITNNGDFSCKTFKVIFGYVMDKYESIVSNMDYEMCKTQLNPWVVDLFSRVNGW